MSKFLTFGAAEPASDYDEPAEGWVPEVLPAEIRELTISEYVAYRENYLWEQGWWKSYEFLGVYDGVAEFRGSRKETPRVPR